MIILYIPSEWIVGIMGRENAWAIIMAALLGIPTYTSNLSALPMVSGLLSQGMSPAAALAFMIAGPTKTLPTMAAVWSLVSHRVFVFYVSFPLVGSIVLGYVKFKFVYKRRWKVKHFFAWLHNLEDLWFDTSIMLKIFLACYNSAVQLSSSGIF